ncbi:MAG: efflux RND transporter periplasmic adaptor subunit [Pelotomaculum sp.]|nr:efflux RND transporter periplasmic adaptor subunit [Pelotomaculum sp.]
MGKWLRISVAGLLVLSIALMAGCSIFKTARLKNEEQDAVAVDKAMARHGKLTGGTVVTGKLEALHSANVVPKMAGKVASITVEVGSQVAEGDLLVSLDAAELAALVDLYAAQLDKARNSDLPAQKTQAELALANAEAAYKTARADYERSKQLREAGVISQQQFEQAEKMYTQAEAAFRAARESLDILVNATIPQTIRQFEAQLRKAQADYANSIIRAPVGGVVTARNVNPGEMASPSQPVVTIVALDPLVVQADVTEDQINYIKVGQELKVRVSSVRDEPFTGIVTNISLAANPSTKAYPVKIQISNPEHVLKPGMFAEVFLNTKEEEGIIVPREAVFKAEDKNFVWVIGDGRVMRREVAVGQSDGRHVIISSGLAEGEEVAVTGIDDLEDGTKVVVHNLIE